MVNLKLRPRALFAAIMGFSLVVNILVLLIPHADLIKIALGFVWLFLLPGWLVTRIVKLDTPSAWERLGFTIGFSLLALMASGLLINTILPLFGINHPMGASELVFGIDVVWTILASWALLPKHSERVAITIPKANRTAVWSVLATIPMLVLTILGAVSLNNSGTGAYTYVMLLYATAYLTLLVVKREKLPESTLLTGIYAVGLCALLMTSLRGWYTTGHDIQREYQVFLITLAHLKWDISYFQDAYNACMSITILPTIVRQIMGVNEVFVYKTVFQALFALVPVLVYLTTRRYSNRLIALLAAIYFIAFPTYAQDMPMLNRQEIAFIFMGLIFLTIFNDTWSLKRRRWLVAMLGLGVVLSHYSTTYTMLTIFLMVVILRYVMRILGNLFTKSTHRRTVTFAHWRRLRPAPLNFAIVVFLLGASYVWSTQLTNTGGNITRVAGETVMAIVKGVQGDSQSSDTNYSLFSHTSLTDQQRLQAYADKTVPQTRKNMPASNLYSETSYNGYKLQIAPAENEPLTPLGHAVQDLGIPVTKFDELTRTGSAIFLQLALGVGILLLFVARPFATRLNSEYRLFQLAQVFLLAAIVVLPVLSAEYGLLRAFQQILLLSGAAIAFATLTLIPSALKRTRVWLPALLAILFFASSTGLITTALGGYPAQLHLANSGKYYDLYYAHTSEQQAMNWLSNAENHNNGSNNISTSIMTDRYTFDRIEQFKNVDVQGDNIYPGVVTRDSYVFLGYTTTIKGVATAFYNNDPLTYIYPIDFLDGNKDEVYASQGARIYK